MKKLLVKIAQIVILVVIIGINNVVYGVGRFVDIPVPPSTTENTSNTTSQTENTTKTENENTEKFVVKSSNNYLKKLEIKDYKIEPEFNNKTNEYTLDLQNDGKETKINIIAETEDNKSKVEGTGEVQVKAGQELININVLAENGNLNVYTIRLKNSQKEETKEEQEVKQEQNTNTSKEEEAITVENDPQETKQEENTSPVKEETKLSKKMMVAIVAVVLVMIIIVANILKKKKGRRYTKRH